MQQEHQFPMPENSGEEIESLGSRLRRLRIARKIGQGEFAQILGVSKQTVWKWERDDVRPRSQSLIAAAAVLGVSETELFSGEARDIEELPLSDVISSCKARIARVAGTDTENVSITINV